MLPEGSKTVKSQKPPARLKYVVKNHLKVIYDKLGIWNRVELALWYEVRRHREETMN